MGKRKARRGKTLERAATRAVAVPNVEQVATAEPGGRPPAAELAEPTSSTEPASAVEPAGRARITPPPATNANVRKSMQGNKRANTKPELLVRQRLREAGLTGYRLQWKVPGRPDVAWPGKRVALFVNGCFWHRCPRCNLALPKSNVEYWVVKFQRNVERDERNLRELEEAGWTVHVLWECQLKKGEIDHTFAELLPKLAEELGKPLKPGFSGDAS